MKRPRKFNRALFSQALDRLAGVDKMQKLRPAMRLLHQSGGCPCPDLLARIDAEARSFRGFAHSCMSTWSIAVGLDPAADVRGFIAGLLWHLRECEASEREAYRFQAGIEHKRYPTSLPAG